MKTKMTTKQQPFTRARADGGLPLDLLFAAKKLDSFGIPPKQIARALCLKIETVLQLLGKSAGSN